MPILVKQTDKHVGYMGKFGHGIRNERGDEFINFSTATASGLNINNRHFQKKKTFIEN